MTAYEMRISDWSSDVCSSDLVAGPMASRISSSNAIGALLAVRGCSSTAANAAKASPIARRAVHQCNRRICTLPPSKPAGRARSEERRVGKECVSEGRARVWRYHLKKTTQKKKKKTHKE